MNKSSLLEEKQLMLNEWKSSGQSITSFCKDRNIAYHSFFYWQKKLSDPASSTQSKFIELPSLPSSPLPYTEIIYPNGKRIVFHHSIDIALLQQLAE